MDWNSGFSAIYYISVVDRETWRDVDRIEITDGSIRRTMTGLRESADVSCVNYTDTSEKIIRIWLDARQSQSSSHIPLFTGLATSPGRNINGRLETNSLQCYSILKLAEDVLLPRGWYAPKDAPGGDIIEQLLKVINVPYEIAENSPTLTYAIIAEESENILSMVDKILDAINWRLTITGRGKIIVDPIPKEPVITFDALDNDVIEPKIDVSFDWYQCPNVFRAISGDESAEARDDDPDSIFSTVNRKREVWASESSSYMNNGESLAEYALRRLRESQQVSTTISYDRRFNPNVNVSDIVQLNYQAQKIFGNYVVTSQTITLGHGASTSEEVVKI